MAFTVGICDDNIEQVQLLIQYLSSSWIGDELKIVESTEPNEFLEKLETYKPDLVFLDIDMSEMNGIQLGEKIKELYDEAVIIYITAYEKYALDAFRIRAFHYLLKPLTKEEFICVLEEALNFIKKGNSVKTDKKFPVQVKGEIMCLNYSDIYYFEKIGHKIKINISDRDILYYNNFSNLLEEIDSEYFIQCHQGYIANVEKFRSFRDRTLILEGNRQLPVSRSFAEGVKEMLARKLFDRKD